MNSPTRARSLFIVVAVFLFTSSVLLPHYCVTGETTMVANENEKAATFGGSNMLTADQGPNNGLISKDFVGARKEKLGGRKMMVDDHVLVKENKEVELNPMVANTLISGANHSVGKYDEEGKKWVLSTKLSERVHFVAFSADYRSPRRHPPKNN